MSSEEAERLPDEIVEATDQLQEREYAFGRLESGVNHLRRDEARTALDATILRHLSAALARAERAEKALERLREPTDEMIAAGQAECRRNIGVIDPVMHVWDAMMDAALSPVAEET